jgi:hypothetical protein
LPSISTRRCPICGKIKPLTAEHFQIIRFLLRDFHFIATPVTQNQKQERCTLRAFEFDFNHDGKAAF